MTTPSCSYTLNPISAEKWYRLCDHLARDNNEFVVIE